MISNDPEETEQYLYNQVVGVNFRRTPAFDVFGNMEFLLTGDVFTDGDRTFRFQGSVSARGDGDMYDFEWKSGWENLDRNVEAALGEPWIVPWSGKKREPYFINVPGSWQLFEEGNF